MSDFDANNILNVLQNLQSRIAMLEGRMINDIDTLDLLSNDMGVQQAGEFRTGVGEPGQGFSGVRMAYPAMDYDVSGSSQSFNIVGVNNDVLQFGLDATSGAAIAGGGSVKIDEDGVTIEVAKNDAWDDQRSLTFHNSGIPGDTPSGIIGGIGSYTDEGDVGHQTIIRSYHPGNSFDYGNTRIILSTESPVQSLTAQFTTSTELDGSLGLIDFSVGTGLLTLVNHGNLSLASNKIISSTPLGCRVYRNSTQALTANTPAALSWNTEVYDTDACWASGEPTKMFAKTAGYYMTGGGFYVASITGHVSIYVQVTQNGTANAIAYDKSYISGAVGLKAISTGMFYMNADDYVIIYALATSNITIQAAGATSEYANFGYLVRIA